MLKSLVLFDQKHFFCPVLHKSAIKYKDMNQNIVVLVNKGQPRNTRFVFRGCSIFYLVVCPEALRYQPFPNYENVQGI